MSLYTRFTDRQKRTSVIWKVKFQRYWAYQANFLLLMKTCKCGQLTPKQYTVETADHVC